MNARGIHTAGALCAGGFLWIVSAAAAAGHPFSFRRDTFDFANETVLEYHQGHASPRHENSSQKPKRFVQHCFVMSRSVEQFRKFARFDPALPPLDDDELAARVRKITSQIPWAPPRPLKDRFVIPGHSDLREFSRNRPEILQKNIGLGWTTYFRPGNWRVLMPHGPAHQAGVHDELERTLARGEFFVAYLTNIPKSLNINHGVLVYGRLKNHGGENKSGNFRYQVYDPNHSDGPRILEWSPRDSCFLYQRDTDFVGGRVVVWQVYGRALQ
jgi:hypothetical protein